MIASENSTSACPLERCSSALRRRSGRCGSRVHRLGDAALEPAAFDTVRVTFLLLTVAVGVRRVLQGRRA